MFLQPKLVLPAALVMTVSSCVSLRACICLSHTSPCGAYLSADLVLVGLVTQVDPFIPAEPFHLQRTVVAVERGYKGIKAGETLEIHQPSHDCAPRFKQAGRYLLYVTRSSSGKYWEVRGCGRSGVVERAADDLRFLNALPGSLDRSRLSGTLEHYDDTPDKGFSLVGALGHTKVHITGKRKLVLETDENGVFEAYDLPAGKYTITLEIPAGLKLRFPMAFIGSDFKVSSDRRSVTVRLYSNMCSGCDFVLSSDTSLSGRVMTSDGVPRKDICVDLRPVNLEASKYFRIFDCTSKDGSYFLKEMPPGEYVLVVNYLRLNSEMPTLYFPGVQERDRAKIVIVRPGDHLEGLDIRLPELARP